VGKTALVAVTILLSASLLSPTQASAVDHVDTEKLRNAVTVNGILQHERVFQRIANENGGTRASGLPGYDASADYVVKKLREAGYKVKRQSFTFPFFRDVVDPILEQRTPTARTIETATFTYSGSGDVTGPVVPIGGIVIPPTPEPSSASGCDPNDFPDDPAANSIALIQRGTCNFEVKVDNAQAAGYAAVIIFNEGQPGRDELLTGTLGNPKTIPAVGISFANGQLLYNDTVGSTGPATARVFTSTETDLNRETVNVIADSPAGKIKGQTIVVGAHLDSVTNGPGINDNGSGSATILEIAEQLAALKYTNKLQRHVRFAFWGAEEPGLYGSEHYVTNLTDAQRAKIYANLNFDMVGSPNYVRFVYDGDGSDTPDAGPPGSDAIEDIFNKYFADQGLASEPTAFDGRSDYGPFIAVGIPAGGLFSGAEGIKTAEQAAVYGGTADVAYDPCYHQACDTITNLNSQALFELGDAAAHATLTLALSKTGLQPDGSRQARVNVTGKAAKGGPLLVS
jgi:Zn-dependent M28 family amino/carboxypeptidase